MISRSLSTEVAQAYRNTFSAKKTDCDSCGNGAFRVIVFSAASDILKAKFDWIAQCTFWIGKWNIFTQQGPTLALWAVSKKNVSACDKDVAGDGVAVRIRSDCLDRISSVVCFYVCFHECKGKKQQQQKKKKHVHRCELWTPADAFGSCGWGGFRVLVGAAPRGGLPTHLIETLPIRESRHGLCVIWADTHLHDCLSKSYILLHFICYSTTVNPQTVIYLFTYLFLFFFSYFRCPPYDLFAVSTGSGYW